MPKNNNMDHKLEIVGTPYMQIIGADFLRDHRYEV